MKIEIENGSKLSNQIVFVSLFAVKADEFKTKTRKDDDGKEQQVTLDGKSEFRTPLKGLRVLDGSPVSEEKNVTIAVLTPTALEAGKYYAPAGKTVITHYVTNTNRLGVSIVAERVELVK